MDTLPIEALEEISKHLTVTELAACSAVSHSWRELFGNDVLWKPWCNEALEETLRTTPCFVEPHFESPQVEPTTLSPIGRWRLAYMRQRHLWKNWQRDNHQVASVPEEAICHKRFISNDLLLRVFDTVAGFSKNNFIHSIELYDIKQFPPTLLHKTPNEHEGFFSSSYYHNNNLVMFYDSFSIVFKLDVSSESVLNYKYKICLPQLEFPDGSETAPRFEITPSVILGWNPIRYKVSETLHIWNMEEGTELKVEKSPKDKPFGFSDVITSLTSDNAVIVISNDFSCESFVLCAHFEPREVFMVTYYFHVYNTNKLEYLPFVKVFEAEHRIRYRCKIHHNFVGIAINGVLRIYNFQSHDLLLEKSIEMKTLGNTLHKSFLDVIDGCFAFISDCTFNLFNPTSQTFVTMVDLQITEFEVVSDSLVNLSGKGEHLGIWNISRSNQQHVCQEPLSKMEVNKSSTRVLKKDTSLFSREFASGDFMSCSFRSIFKCPSLTEWFYYW